ncbi:MAG TPA: aminotransferase class IV [Gemmatimonadales bacterium]|nr:aminotransferase class IV [Gemmatimonadales bacterium]
MLVYLNGSFLDRGRAAVSVDDRGFLFGDGVYEVTRAHQGRLFEPERHLARLERGLDALRITPPPTLDRGALVAISDQLVRENGLSDGDATVYLQITRGAAERTHHFPPPGTRPSVFLSAQRLVVPDDVRARGASAITTADQRWARCDVKTIQLLPNVLAKQRAVAAGAFEAILTRDGVVTEGASTNVFASLDGVLRTHPLDHRILGGVTRAVVLELAGELGLAVSERALTVDELARVSELFLTATTVDVMPVVKLDGRPVGDGRPGSVARRLHEALRARVARPTPVAVRRAVASAEPAP